MARKRRGGIPKYAFVALAVIVVGGFLIVGLPFIDNSIDLSQIFQSTDSISNTAFFSLPQPFQLFSIGDTVDCKIFFTMVAKNQLGQTIATLNSPPNTSPLYINLDLLKRGGTGTPSDTIRDYTMTPKISCDNKAQSTTGGATGYFLPHPQVISFSSTFKNPNGQSVAGGSCQTPKFSHGDLGDNIERWMPSCTILASTIDDRAPLFSTPYDSEVHIVMGGELKFTATTGGTGSFGTYQYFIGSGSGGVQIVKHLITIDKDDGTVPTGIQSLSINRLERASDRANLLTSHVKINSLEDDELKSSVRVEALVSGWRDVNLGEAIPSGRIFQCLDTTCNSNRAITGLVRLNQLSSSDLFIGTLEVPQGAEAGHYAFEVTSPDRSQKASRGFMVEQISIRCPSGEEGTPPNCSPIIDPSPDPTCADDGLTGVYPNCDSETTCEEQGQVTQTDGSCADEDTGGTTDPMEPDTTPTGGAKGKIEYTTNFLDPLEGGGGSCVDTGSIPTSGVDIQAFQLIAGTGKCGGNQFVSIDIRPIIDFGSATVNVDKGSVMLDKQIWVSVNNPFPATPKWGTGDDPTAEGSTCRITSAQLPTSCIISNHDFSIGTKKSSFTAKQFQPVTQLRSGTSIYDVALITISSAEIEKKIEDAGLQLRDGDEYAFLVQFVTKFSATVGNTQIDGVVPATALHYSFNYAEGADVSCNLTVSFLKETCVILDDGVTEQCTTQCVPRDTNDCPRAGETFNRVSMTCEPEPMPQDPDCPNGLVPPDFSPFNANQCVQPESPNMCEPVPMCSSTEKLDVTGTTDNCGFEILTCVPKTMGADGCADDQQKDSNGNCVAKKPDIVEPNPTGGCDPEYVLNAFGNCQRIGSGTQGNGGGGGATDEVNFCATDKFFESPARCFSQLFGGAETLTAGGEPDEELSGLLVIVVLVIIIIIIVAVVIRVRRGRGFGS